MDEIVIATRGSALALWQAHAVEGTLRELFPDLHVRLEVMTTTGDRNLASPLSQIGDKGLFTKELELALLEGRAHIAVHSLKDMQTNLPEGLALGAVTARHRAEDALVARPETTLANMREGATVATGSLRRTAQLRALRPDLDVIDIRGNVGTRIEKYHANGWDGMILARAGLERLGLESEIAEIIPTSIMLPAVGQGALGIECRADDESTLSILSALEHRQTRLCVEAERALLRTLEGGCQVPIGAHAALDGDMLLLDGVIASLDGAQLVREAIAGPSTDPAAIGVALAERLRELGGGEILRGARGEIGKMK